MLEIKSEGIKEKVLLFSSFKGIKTRAYVRELNIVLKPGGTSVPFQLIVQHCLRVICDPLVYFHLYFLAPHNMTLW